MRATAEDWHEELSGYPGWAIQKAARWWMGQDNPERRKKPLAGDISARAKLEMGVVKLAESAVRRFERGGSIVQTAGDNEPRVTADRAAEILAAANIGVKRMEGE